MLKERELKGTLLYDSLGSRSFARFRFSVDSEQWVGDGVGKCVRESARMKIDGAK